MAIKIKFGKYPNHDIVQWFVDHIGPRTHHLPDTIGGKGWLFEFEETGPAWDWRNVAYREWYLTVDDEYGKTLTYYLLMR